MLVSTGPVEDAGYTLRALYMVGVPGAVMFFHFLIKNNSRLLPEFFLVSLSLHKHNLNTAFHLMCKHDS